MGEWIAELEGRHRQPIVGSGPTVGDRAPAPRIERPMARHRPVDSAQSFPELEQEVLERWRERDVFHESIRREGAPLFVFYEGPPTANGRPGSHHVLSRVQGRLPALPDDDGPFRPAEGRLGLPRLPVELEIEKELGFTNKHDIERYGSPSSTRSAASRCCATSTRNELTERIGFWIDTDDAYYTLERLHRIGLGVAAGLRTRPGPRATGSFPTFGAAGPRCRATRWRWATATRSTCRCT